MKRVVLLCMSFISCALYTMHTDGDYKKIHAQLICQKYSLLSPIKHDDTEGSVRAYYASQEGRTRILITRKNNTDGTINYEKASIDTDQDIKTPPGEIDLRGYKGLLDAYENYVKNGSFEQLSLRQ